VGKLAPLLSTAMEAEDPDAGLGSRLVLQMSVGPDCHSGVLVSSKTQVFCSKEVRDESVDAPRQVRCTRKLSCRYTDFIQASTVQYSSNMRLGRRLQSVVWRSLKIL
jgi:hypothetical protein